MCRLIPLVIVLVLAGWGTPIDVVAREATPVPPGTPELLDEETLHALAILGFAPDETPGVVNVSTLGAAIGLLPGDAVALVLGVYDYEVCAFGIRCFVPNPAFATWSIDPADGARIDPATGLLTIDPATLPGSRFTVTAEVEAGRHVVTTEIHVYTAEANPLVGYWQEEAQLTCGDGTEVTPALPIEELVFAVDGTFAVTWMPFESYVDYWGAYVVDIEQGKLELTVTNGNNVPADIDGSGRISLDAAGRLTLTEMWLGVPQSGRDPSHCGHRFVG